MGLPLDLAFRTKGQLAIDICTAAYADGISFDFTCGDEVYGSCTQLREFFEDTRGSLHCRPMTQCHESGDLVLSGVS